MAAAAAGLREPDAERVRALEALPVVPTGREERFDRITRLARRLFGVRIAAVTLADADTQWVKSIEGLDAESVPLEHSFCRYALAAPEPETVVEDARADTRFAGHPSVTGGPRVRFYAGRPLTTAAGTRVGTLCLFDPDPRGFGEVHRAVLAELAGWAEAELQRSAEMERAAEVQRALLPGTATLTVPGYVVAGTCVPAHAVGGDLLDWYRADPPADGGPPDVVLTLADVMGRGVGAALVMAAVRAAMRTAGRRAGPAEAVREAALALEDDLAGTGTLVTLCHARLDVRSGAVRWTDAGHGLLVLVRADGSVHRPAAGGLPLGVRRDDRWPEHRVDLRPDDVVLALSNGVLDLFPSPDEALDRLVLQARADPVGCVAEIGRRARATALADDATLLVVRRCR